MRTLHLSVLFPLILQAAPPRVSMEEAQTRILESYDQDPSLQRLPALVLRAKDRPAQDWLLGALKDKCPRIPFPKGSEAYREASRLHDLLDASPGERPARLRALTLNLAGTQAALWRWGQALAQGGELPPALRQEWEDRLLQEQCAPVIRGWAMRHAFCFALTEADEARFDTLKATCVGEVPDLVRQFQRAFALLG